MVEEPHIRRREVALCMDRARQMLVVAECNLNDGFYASAVNRAYYAIFISSTRRPTPCCLLGGWPAASTAG